jgi:predicted P-loop ATPase
MTVATSLHPLEYYARNGFALFPIPAGQKSPVGIVESFARDCSTDPTQWVAWQTANPGCNFGVVAGPSRIIIVDVDTKGDGGRDEAWQQWCDLCAAWGIAVVMPQVQSARGGWHIYFSVPDGVDSKKLRQPDAIKGRVNTRAGNGFTVTAGSHFENLPYVLLSDAAPYPAPAALLALCTRAESKSNITKVGTLDRGDVEKMVRWMTDHEMFLDEYNAWLGVGMALKLEFGDAGLDLWRITHRSDVTPEVEATKWASFSSDPDPDVQTLATWVQEARKAGWTGSIYNKSADAMFGGLVAQIAKASGATLAGGLPVPSVTGGGEAIMAAIVQPYVEAFLAATKDQINTPRGRDYPTLPDAAAGHPLFCDMQTVLSRFFAMAEVRGTLKGSQIVDIMAALRHINEPVYSAVTNRALAMGVTWPARQIANAYARIEKSYNDAIRSTERWSFNPKTNNPDPDLPHNVVVMLETIGCEIRMNTWLNQLEIRGGADKIHWQDWTKFDDVVLNKLYKWAYDVRFKVTKDFLKSILSDIADENKQDPVVNEIEALRLAWDGTPRLATWLTATLGVSCDLYHQAVSRNVIGGIVKRALSPGCKHDEVMILMGAQGTGKSTLCRALALNEKWFSDSVSFAGTPQNTIPQLFGKLVIELGELDGMQKTEVEGIKRILSTQSDSVTLKYQTFTSEHPRRCVFIGTSNEHAPLVDITGNRRFLPVRVQSVNLDWLNANVRQLIGEAAQRYKDGESFSIPKEIWPIAAEHQEAARTASDVETLLTEWFGESDGHAITFVLGEDLISLAKAAGWRERVNIRTAIMHRLGFVNELTYVNGRRVRVWIRKPADVRTVDAVRTGYRYAIGVDNNNWPKVLLRGPGISSI